MGFNTTVVVLNDALGTIENDPKFGKRLADAIAKLSISNGEGIDVAAHTPAGGIHCNAATVIETHHAEGTAIVAIGGNYGTKLGEVYKRTHHEPGDDIEIFRMLADQRGYTLQPKKKLPRNGKRRNPVNKGAS